VRGGWAFLAMPETGSCYEEPLLFVLSWNGVIQDRIHLHGGPVCIKREFAGGGGGGIRLQGFGGTPRAGTAPGRGAEERWRRLSLDGSLLVIFVLGWRDQSL